MAAPTLLQGTNYHAVSGGNFQLVATDINGKVFSEISVIIDEPQGIFRLFLPAISSLPVSTLTIKVVVKTNPNNQPISFIADENNNDRIGDSPRFDLLSTADGSFVVFTVADQNVWAYYTTLRRKNN